MPRGWGVVTLPSSSCLLTSPVGVSIDEDVAEPLTRESWLVDGDACVTSATSSDFSSAIPAGSVSSFLLACFWGAVESLLEAPTRFISNWSRSVSAAFTLATGSSSKGISSALCYLSENHTKIHRTLDKTYPDGVLGLNSATSALSGCSAGTGVEAFGVPVEVSGAFS